MLHRSALGPWATLALSGEFDAANSDDVRSAVHDLVDQGVTDLTVDLSAVTFISAATLNALVAADNQIRSVGGRLMTVGVGGFTARVFAAAHLSETLSVFTALCTVPETTEAS